MPKNLKSHLESISESPLPAGSGVARTSIVATRLELLPFNVPVITVAGTNGKGSCAAFLEAILLAERLPAFIVVLVAFARAFITPSKVSFS